MKNSILTALFNLLCIPILLGQITGQVHDTDGEPLPGVSVYIMGSYDGTTTDIEGRFSFRTYEVGEQTLVASFIGYKTHEEVLTMGESHRLDIRLKEEVNRLSGVTITAGSFEASDEQKATVLKPLDIAMTAGAGADVSGALNMLPGTTTNGETGRLFVRGGTANETQAFVDGIWVSNFYTTTPSNVPSRGRFDPFLFKGTFFSTGGYSAEYGQALSSVLSLNSLDLADETITDISLMSVGGAVAHTQRWDQGSVYAKIEYMNLDPYMNLVKQTYDWKDGFTSANGTFMLRQKINKQDMLKVYANYDRSGFHAIIPSINNPAGDDTKVQNDNTYLNATYKKGLGDAGMAYFGVSYGLYHQDTDYNAIRVEGQNKAVHAKSYYTTDIGSLSLKAGGEMIRADEKEDTRLVDNSAFDRAYDNTQLAGFVEGDYFLTQALTLRAGLRYAHYSVFEEGQWSPRVSMAYKTGEYSQVSAAFGQFHQLPQRDLMLAAQDYILPEQADHYILSYQRIKEGFTFRGELYYKTYEDLVRYDADDIYNPTTYTNSGEGYARGIDLFFRDAKTIKNADYWVSYSFIDSKRDYRNYPQQVRPEFAAMHNVSVVYKHFIPVIRTQIGATWDFNSGRPYNDPNEDEFNNQKTKYYANLSFNFAFLYRPHVILYASATNLLGRDNVFGYDYADTPDASGVYDSQAIGQQAKRFFFVGVFISLTKDKKTNQLEYL
ncbi:Outer membrane receptor for ferrienterochelin and colicins [Reichenbachiella agariperforans]|uniref:Outer membrane receptor for ferrienterochelin and colicins n=1 Tax=Reichenbachiella agariperforans TaxID=156994 RepID=A0A1M6KWS2_REIAG|nr:TonB-dependent receptor [Reichenbachiella agariperforans]SHJ63352.1 Outer membrane receptor for ferrienterochelin and colicins [Reichenbachiella agariperforans]